LQGKVKISLPKQAHVCSHGDINFISLNKKKNLTNLVGIMWYCT
jgi:hypothetical protein